MNPLTLNIGQTYIYRANGYVMEVEYIAPFLDPDGLNGWHDFLVKSTTQKGRISMPGVCMVKEETDTEIITISGDIVNSRQLTAKSQPETKIEISDQSTVNSQQSTVISDPSEKETSLVPVPPMPDIKEIDIAFTNGGRSDTHNIKGTCLRNVILHAYSYLHKRPCASDIRIYVGHERLGFRSMRSLGIVDFINLIEDSVYQNSPL